MGTDYASPVVQLMTLGKPRGGPKPSDYPDLGPEHVPELIRLATDRTLRNSDSEGPEPWAPVHAWRALGQLGPEAATAAEPLVELLGLLSQSVDGDEWATEELPAVLGMVGAPAVAPAARLLADAFLDATPRIVATKVLQEISERFPSTRGACLAALTAELARSEIDEGQWDLNGFVVSALVRLHAVEALPALQTAFEADQVPTGVCGDWDAVQVYLGVKEPTDVPGPSSLLYPGAGYVLPPPPEGPSGGFRDSGAVRKRTAAEKSKKKAAKLSRRKNRR